MHTMNTTQVHCYRVWMKDDYAGLYNAYNEDDAKALAVAAATKNIEGAAMSPAERRQATSVDYAERLSD